MLTEQSISKLIKVILTEVTMSGDLSLDVDEDADTEDTDEETTRSRIRMSKGFSFTPKVITKKNMTSVKQTSHPLWNIFLMQNDALDEQQKIQDFVQTSLKSGHNIAVITDGLKVFYDLSPNAAKEQVKQTADHFKIRISENQNNDLKLALIKEKLQKLTGKKIELVERAKDRDCSCGCKGVCSV